ncbi:hypothetical protein JCM8547_000545 [Rhodosporidiobolus lusitaniae]
MAAEFTSRVLKLISDLPEGANPYSALQDFLWTLVRPKMPSSFRGQLVALIILYALCLLFVVGSLVVRIWQKTFWVLHLGHSPSLIRPHFSVSWSLWAVILVILLEVQITQTQRYYDTGSKDFMWFMIFSWMPGFLGGITAVWSILVSYCLHLSTYGHMTAVERATPYINGAAISIPIVYLICIVPPACLCSIRFSRATKVLGEIDALLGASAATYDGSFAITDLAAGLPLLQSAQTEFMEFLRLFSIVYGIFSGFVAFLTLAVASVSTLYILVLGKALKVAESMGSQGTSSRGSQRRVMAQTYSNLLITVIAFTILSLVFCITSILISRNPTGLANPHLAQLFLLLPLWTFAVLGLPTAVLLFWRSFDRSGQKSSTVRSNQVSVSVRVEFAEDHQHGPSFPDSMEHGRKGSIAYPYPHARTAFALPMPENFEMVDQKRRLSMDGGYEEKLGWSSEDDHQQQQQHHQLAVPSPGYAPESPVVGRWSTAFSPTDSSVPSLASPPPGNRRRMERLSEASLTDSLQANRDSMAAFSFGTTRTLTPETTASRPESTLVITDNAR